MAAHQGTLQWLHVIGWATLFVSAGYWAGEALEHFLGDLKPYRLPILIAVVALVILAALVQYLRRRRKAAHL
jgi:membrane protein DedA with SNARE-associated domain